MSKFGAGILLITILLGSLFFMVWSSLGESGTMDELAHIPSGYSYMRYLDYRLNPEHPPILKDLAAFPLLFLNLNFPTDHQAFSQDVNGQWWTGNVFLYESGNDADLIIQLARLGPMFITLLLIILTYLWSAQLLGRWWAFLPTTFLAYSPTILAHGHYVTTDVAAAFGIVFALYFFANYLKKPSKKTLVYAGVALGIAQLMKFSAVLLFPFFVAIAIVHWLVIVSDRWKNTPNGQRKNLVGSVGFSRIKSLVAIFVISFLVIWPLYFVHTLGYPPEKQFSDTSTILTTFGEGVDPAWESCNPTSGVSLSRRMRCLANVTIWASDKPVLRAYAQYALGILMVIQRSSAGNTGYFLGEVSRDGWWYYFPVLFLLKEPLASVMLGIFSMLLLVYWYWHAKHIHKATIKKRAVLLCEWIKNNFDFFVIASFTIFYWAYSIRSPLNIGIRHIIPTLPLIYILVFAILKRWVGTPSLSRFYTSVTRMSVLSFFVLLYLLSTFSAAPYFISFFNSVGGGVNNGYIYAVDSNYDWGQDLRRLRTWVNEQNTDSDESNNVEKLAIDYFGAGNPEYYFGDLTERWSSRRGNPKDEGITWFAVSVSFLQSGIGKTAPQFGRDPQDEYSWLNSPSKPYAKAGKSIFIYKLQ